MEDKLIASAASGLVALLPGFVAAWIFFGLTSHRKPDKFERVVQALVFSVIIQALVAGIRILLVASGRLIVGATGINWLPLWSPDANVIWSVIAAVGVGFVLVYYTNNGRFHGWLNDKEFTNRTSHPSEWYSILKQACHVDPRRILFHLDGERRLEGHVEEWPDHCDSGHFIIADCKWVLDNNLRVPLHTVYRMVIPATEIKMMEVEKRDDEVKVTEKELSDAMNVLVELQTQKEKEGQDVSEGS